MQAHAQEGHIALTCITAWKQIHYTTSVLYRHLVETEGGVFIPKKYFPRDLVILPDQYKHIQYYYKEALAGGHSHSTAGVIN